MQLAGRLARALGGRLERSFVAACLKAEPFVMFCAGMYIRLKLAGGLAVRPASHRPDAPLGRLEPA